ncbi:MAG: 1-acyl-sn-glycerol-3-phosphate acyltransferase, partial [Nanoarchaeota archaeon]
MPGLTMAGLLDIIQADPCLKEGELTPTQRTTLKNIMPAYDAAYLREVCERRGHILRTLIKNSVVKDDEATLYAIKGRQALHLSNHLSHFDYLQQLYTIRERGCDPPRIGGRSSVFIPSLEEAWKKCGAFKLPSHHMGAQDARIMMLLLRGIVASGQSILLYPEGGRSYDGKLKEFKTGGVGAIHRAAQDFDKDMVVVPHYLWYDVRVEDPAWPLLDACKR